MTARPMASDLRLIPGPEVVVTPREPEKEAPMAELTPAISSSAWKVTTLWDLRLDSSCRMSEAGVMGYEPRKSCNPARLAPVMRP